MGTTNAQTDPEHTKDDTYINGSSIEAFFADSVILVTGATGFLGKALLEKLLRSCPTLAMIFILIRPKRKQTVEQRFADLLENSVFDKIRNEHSGLFKKIQPLEGDVTLPNLGLSAEDRNMLAQRVNIVYHSAATVRFDEPLKVAVNLNTRGTERVLELCKSMKNLISIIHVSTAYSNANLPEIQESVYTTNVKPNTIIEMCESLDNETLQVIEKKILETHPNTYTFTKNLAEQIVMSKGADLPIAIVRPSIICASARDPFPGWVDNICGITGIMMQIGRGIIRSIRCNPALKIDLVPIDFVVDTLICASWHNTMQNNNSNVKIYNCTNGAQSLRWGELASLVNKHAREQPTSRMLWYPGVTFRSSKFMHNFISATLHFFPAFLTDLLLRLQGNKPIMWKSAKFFERMTRTGEFFALHEWDFDRRNMIDLTKKLQVLKDCDNFNTDMTNVNWDVYIRHYMAGIRKYLLKEDPVPMKQARTRLLKLYWIHRLTQLMSLFTLLVMIRSAGR